jgi:hypothetical protein
MVKDGVPNGVGGGRSSGSYAGWVLCEEEEGVVLERRSTAEARHVGVHFPLPTHVTDTLPHPAPSTQQKSGQPSTEKTREQRGDKL